MAENNGGNERGGLIQWVRLALDQRSREQLKEDAAASGADAGKALAGGASAGAEQTQGVFRRAFDAVKNAGKSAADNVGKAFKSASDNIRGWFNDTAKGILAGYAAIATAQGIKNFIGDMWELGSAADETRSKFATTFGSATQDVQNWIDQWGTLLGLNKTMARDMSATMGSIVQGMGMAQDKSGEFSQQVMKLAGDLQSFHNVPIEETFAAIKSGLIGSYLPLDRFGIVVRGADVELKALSMTGKKNADELTQQEKAVASLALMYERAGPALDDVARTQDSTSNQARSLTAEFENLKIELAEQLLPAFGSLVEWLAKNKEGLVSFVKGGLTAAIYAGQFLWGVLHALSSLLSGVLMLSIAFSSKAMSEFNGILADTAELVAKVARLLGAGGLADSVADFAQNARARANRMQGRAAAFGQGALDSVKDTFGGFNFGAGFGEGETWEWEDRKIVDPSLGNPAAEERKKNEAEKARQKAEREAERKRREAEKARRDAERDALEKERALELELSSLQQVLAFRKLTEKEQQRVTELQKQFTDELEKGNTTLEREVELRERLAQLKEVADTFDPAVLASKNAQEQYENRLHLEQQYRDIVMEIWAPVGDFLQDIAGGFANSWQDAFALIVEEGASAGEAISTLGKGMAASIVGALGSIARTKMAQNVASAVENIAEGISLSALPWTAWAAPAKFSAAAKHGAAALAWGALAGGAGAIAGAIGGGGSSGSAGGHAYHSPGNVGGKTAERADKMGAEIHVHVDGIQPNNPEHQRLMQQTVAQMQERYGSKGTIELHPRGG